MSTLDEQMIQAMVPSLLSELAIELQIPRTEHFCYTERAVQDLWDGLRKRITTVVIPAISQLFLEYLNDIYIWKTRNRPFWKQNGATFKTALRKRTVPIFKPGCHLCF